MMPNPFICLFLVGLVLISWDTSHGYVHQTSYQQTGWRKYRRGYSIREMKHIITLTEDEKIISGLRGVILRRRIGYGLIALILLPFIFSAFR